MKKPEAVAVTAVEVLPPGLGDGGGDSHGQLHDASGSGSDPSAWSFPANATATAPGKPSMKSAPSATRSTPGSPNR
jgi:hypothetical protein